MGKLSSNRTRFCMPRRLDVSMSPMTATRWYETLK
jgi:hypothetical protein